MRRIPGYDVDAPQSRAVTSPYSCPRLLSYLDAQDIAQRGVADSYSGVNRDDLEALCQWVLQLDETPVEALCQERKARRAAEQRADAAELEAQWRDEDRRQLRDLADARLRDAERASGAAGAP